MGTHEGIELYMNCMCPFAGSFQQGPAERNVPMRNTAHQHSCTFSLKPVLVNTCTISYLVPAFSYKNDKIAVDGSAWNTLEHFLLESVLAIEIEGLPLEIKCLPATTTTSEML